MEAGAGGGGEDKGRHSYAGQVGMSISWDCVIYVVRQTSNMITPVVVCGFVCDHHDELGFLLLSEATLRARPVSRRNCCTGFHPSLAPECCVALRFPCWNVGEL